ncbi:hypothetical protein AB4Y80_03380 [Specibacter sp. RAF43]
MSDVRAWRNRVITADTGFGLVPAFLLARVGRRPTPSAGAKNVAARLEA